MTVKVFSVCGKSGTSGIVWKEKVLQNTANISGMFTEKNHGEKLSNFLQIRKMRTAAIFFVLLVMTTGVLRLAYNQGFYRFNNPDPSRFPVRGLDVSHHQGAIDWSRVPRDEFSFVYIKATEGGDFKDKRFQENWVQAKENGFRVGAYHFFTLCRDGRAQAENFIQAVPAGYDSLPPAIDLEFIGNCSQRPARENFEKELSIFMNDVQKNYKKRAVIYTTYDFYKAYLKDSPFEDEIFWVRDILREPDNGVFPRWAVWQYADNVRVDGIETPVDANVLNGQIQVMQ